MSITDLFGATRNYDAGTPTLEGQSEGSDSAFSKLFQFAQAGADIYNGVKPVENTNAATAAPPVVQKAVQQQKGNTTLLLIGGAVLLVIVLMFGLRK
jgi:hypothetical protein